MGVGESLDMSAIFHYTDSNGLLGILSSNSLFATHYKYLNDLTEGAAIRDLILPIIEDEIAEITPKLVVRGGSTNCFMRFTAQVDIVFKRKRFMRPSCVR